MFGNEKVSNIGTIKMIILQLPRMEEATELYTHMPFNWSNVEVDRVLT